MDIKSWLESAMEPVAEVCFTDPPALPYVVFLDTVQHRGADFKNLLIEHDLQVERYSETEDDNAALEALFDVLPVEWKKDKAWDTSNGWFETVYTMNFTEKIGG